ncbi:hypothetical protein R3W88_022667 [Solanum pinnatisectum]|uniref:Uncharacterized protein n=1 Tax=Solanum pinnatisectum TaxID=50273 RepID=A0AAV9LYM4_9SOLN|nr:hypothetical protein R3W88_022667 [Solanum pinnatisectum]
MLSTVIHFALRYPAFISSSLLLLHSRTNPRPARGNLCTPLLPFGRPSAGSPHRHRYVYFTKPLSKTVPRSLYLLCGSEPYHCNPLCEEEPLLSMLRGYFFEFLRESCLAPRDISSYPHVGSTRIFTCCPLTTILGPNSTSWVTHSSIGRLWGSFHPWELTISCSISLPDGFLPFFSLLLRELLFLSFPLATKMFQLSRLSLSCPWIHQQSEMLPYSRISKSMLIFNFLKHFIDYYALSHLLVSRYPS